MKPIRCSLMLKSVRNTISLALNGNATRTLEVSQEGSIGDPGSNQAVVTPATAQSRLKNSAICLAAWAVRVAWAGFPTSSKPYSDRVVSALVSTSKAINLKLV